MPSAPPQAIQPCSPFQDTLLSGIWLGMAIFLLRYTKNILRPGGAVPAVPAVVRTPRQVTLEQLVTMLLEVDIGLAYLTEQVS